MGKETHAKHTGKLHDMSMHKINYSFDIRIKLSTTDSSRAMEASVTSLLTESTRRLLGRTPIDPSSINTRATIMDEYHIKLTSWIKESSKLEDENIKMYGLIYANCDSRLRQELDKEAEFAELEMPMMGLSYYGSTIS